MTNRALITGASRGLGLALARALAADGWELVIDARGENDLRAAAADLGPAAAVHAVPGDVADEAHRLDLAAAVDALGGGLDLLVHNASRLGPSPQPSIAIRTRHLPCRCIADRYSSQSGCSPLMAR